MIRQRIIFTLLLLLFVKVLHAQYYAPGTDPLGFRWKQIKTPHTRIVFAEDMTHHALRLASIFDTLYHVGGYSLKHKPRKISVLLHSRTTYSNGFVSWAPRRSEFFTTPSQGLGSMDWLQHLAIHEYRHVIQMDKLNTGFTRFLGYLLGEQAIGAVGGLYLPFWFLEGDAVLTETLLSESGRGRKPQFEQEIRAQLLERNIYSMNKAYLGSYNHYVPNHYNMGYLLVAGARNRYGSDLWSNILQRVGRRSWGLAPFKRSLMKNTGMGKRDLYKSVFAEWQEKWLKQDSAMVYGDYSEVTLQCKDYVSYRYSQLMDNHNIIAEKSGPGVIKSFVKIDAVTGKEETVLVPGLHDDEPFGCGYNMIAWSEMEPHWRWENQMYSNIYVYDLQSGVKKKLSEKGRLFSPVIIDGKALAVIAIGEDNSNSIEIIDVDGNHLKNFPTPNNDFPLNPTYDSVNENVVMILQGRGGKRISALNISSGVWRDITEPSFNEIRLPKVDGDWVYYTSSESGIENIFRIPLKGGNVGQVTSERFGASGAIVAGNDSIIYSRYSSNGYRLAKTSAIGREWGNEDILNPGNAVVANAAKGEMPKVDWDNLPLKEYPVKLYSRFNLFNVHSWAPSFISVDDEDVKAGVSVMSQNLLGTMIAVGGYNAANDSELEKYYVDLTFRGWYPVLSLNVTSGDRGISSSYFGVSGSDTLYVAHGGTMEQTKVKGTVSLPINLSKGRYYRYVAPSVAVEYRNNSGYYTALTQVTLTDQGWQPKGTTTLRKMGSINYTDVQYGVLFHNLRRGTSRDVGTRWGQSLQLKYRHTPWGSDNLGSMWGGIGRLYLPGLMKYHQVRLGVGYQKKYYGDIYSTSASGYQPQYLYSDFLSFPRGYSKKINDELVTASVNYNFPLVNPDFSIGSFMYVKRLRTNLFYDVARGWSHQKYVGGNDVSNRFTISSLGAEFVATAHFFQFIVPVELGVRMSWLTSRSYMAGEFILGINIASLTGTSR